MFTPTPTLPTVPPLGTPALHSLAASGWGIMAAVVVAAVLCCAYASFTR